QLVENWATGKYPIGLGLNELEVTKFVANGVVKSWSKIDPDPITSLHPSTLAVLKNPPNPNATKLFVNWFLSQEAQLQRIKDQEEAGTGNLSRRADVSKPNLDLVPGWDQIDYKHSLLAPDAVEVRANMLQLGIDY